MSNKLTKSASQHKLTDEEVKVAAKKMMLGAQAHQRASVYCKNNPNSEPPSMDGVFFFAVSFELILNSIEQSLRLLLLIHYSTLRPIHNIFSLYKAVLNMSGGKVGIRSDIVNRVNVHSSSIEMNSVTENDIRACLKKHDSSYSNFRYFGLDEEGRSTSKWEAKEYEIKLLHCLAAALIEVNVDEMNKRGMEIYSSVKKVPESDMTDELKQVMARMKEQSTR